MPLQGAKQKRPSAQFSLHHSVMPSTITAHTLQTHPAMQLVAVISAWSALDTVWCLWQL